MIEVRCPKCHNPTMRPDEEGDLVCQLCGLLECKTEPIYRVAYEGIRSPRIPYTDTCPKCGSPQIIKLGIIKGQRWQCKDCEKYWYTSML